ncbi:MAG: hypothetical protein M2R45_02515 [Verrucomicrobia subdivision 3 bacterium]|nr:hypothetical protein [Limisphaerales bacterium]MCS1414278.1 hypothetical protein [Limisphaerales bacterium]
MKIVQRQGGWHMSGGLALGVLANASARPLPIPLGGNAPPRVANEVGRDAGRRWCVVRGVFSWFVRARNPAGRSDCA